MASKTKKDLIGVMLRGRRDIFTSADHVDESNVLTLVNEALSQHFLNVDEEYYLYWYRRGEQPILERTKKRNAFVNNKVVENHAQEFCTFKQGYFLMEPCAYVSRNDAAQAKVAKLNEYLYRSGKQTADNVVSDWFFTVGKGVIYVESNDDEDVPVRAYAVDPRSAFVVYSLRPGNKPVFGVNIVMAGEDTAKIDVYTRDKVFRLIGAKAGPRVTQYPVFATVASEIVGVEENPIPYIPLIEYRYNKTNTSCFELVIPLFNGINILRSNQIDGVEQFIQSIAVAVNCQFDEGTSVDKIKEAGMIVLSSIGDNKASFQILSEELNQDQTETLVDSLYDQALRIAAMPTTARDGRGTYDSTGIAAIFNNGWELAAADARNTEDLFRESNAYFDEIITYILREKGLLDIKLSDFRLNFVRNETANVQSKAQAAQTMLASGLHPEIALKKSGLSGDPVADVERSQKYLRMIWGDPDKVDEQEEQTTGTGEADIVEDERDTGEATEGNV